MWKKQFQRWLKRRIPRQRSHQLQHRNIFIMPSKAGLGFVFMLSLLWLLGTNYQNNLVLSLAFLLLSLLIICMHHTYGNLAGLHVSVINTEPGFMGGEGRVTLLVKKNSARKYEAITLAWAGGSSTVISLLDEDQVIISLLVPLTQRGWFQPPYLRIFTDFPLGLIVAWSYLDVEALILSYPKPVESSVRPIEQLEDDSDGKESQMIVTGNQEFAGLREYKPGDSLRNIDWRALARGQGMATRIYEDNASKGYWLDWRQFAGLSTEVRLSRLCACVLKHSGVLQEYGLRLPDQTIEPGYGSDHQRKLLEALALFEWQDSLKESSNAE